MGMKRKNLLYAMLCLMMVSSMIMAEKIIRTEVNETPILGRSLTSTTGDDSFTITNKAVTSTTLSSKGTVKRLLAQPTLSDNSVFYYTGDTSISTLTFTEDEIDTTMFTMIKAIKASPEKEVDFELVAVPDTLNAFTLKITTTMTATSWGKYDSLEIFGIDETTALYSLTPFIIINADTIPKSFPTAYQNGVFVSKQLATIEVHFEQEIYPEYFAEPTPRLSIEGHSLGVKTGAGNEKIMTITKTTADTYFSTETLVLKRTESTDLEISIKLCTEFNAPGDNNKCERCTGASLYYYFDKGTCIADCTSLSLLRFDEQQACYSDCADVTGKAYKEKETCVRQCATWYGINIKHTECLPIEIAELSTHIYGKTPAQNFNIIFNVEVNPTRVQGFGFYTLPSTESTETRLYGCSYKTNDEMVKNVFKCTSDITLPKGVYYLFWYPNDSKYEEGYRKIYIEDIVLKNVFVVSISKEIIELFSSQNEFAITYTGDFNQVEYSIALVNVIPEMEEINISTSNGYGITVLGPVVTIKMPADFSYEGQYYIRTSHSASTQTPNPSTHSSQIIMFYKAGIKLLKSTQYIPNYLPGESLQIFFTSFIFTARIESITYVEPGDTNLMIIDSTKYKVSSDDVKLNVFIYIESSIPEYKLVIKLITVTPNAPEVLEYTIKRFAYPKTVSIIDRIFEAKGDNYIHIRFDAEVFDPSVFKFIQAISGHDTIKLILGERITTSNSEPPSFDYKLLLYDLGSAPEVNKYTSGIDFYDTQKIYIKTLLTIQKEFILVKEAKFPKIIVPVSFLIAENVLEVKFKFGETETIFCEYFIEYNNKPAKIFISTPDTITLACDEETKEITAKSTEAITTNLQLSSFGTPIEIPVTVCSIPKLITDGECKLCTEIDKTKPYYDVDGSCIAKCPAVYLEYVCYLDCPEIEGKQYYAEDSKKCVKTCPDGQIGYDKVCVDILFITSMTTPIYAMTSPQTITITTDPVENFKGGFKLQKVDKTFKKDITCLYAEGSKTNHVCLVDTWAQVPVGDYEIKWGEALPYFNPEGYAFTIRDKSVESITVDTLNPVLGKLPTGDIATVDFTLTYFGNYDAATTTIELINVDTQAKVSIPPASIESVEDDAKQIKLKLKSTIPEGAYYISTSANGKTVTSTKSFTVFLEDEIALLKESIIYEVDAVLKNEAIAFSKAVFPSRIEKVEIGANPVMFKFEAEKLIIQKTIRAETGPTVITITYKSLPTNLDVMYTINGRQPESSINYPKIDTFDNKIYYHGKTPIPFSLKFDIPITKENSISSIQTAEKNIKFTIEPSDIDNRSFRLILVDPSLSTTWGKYTSIKFYAKTADGHEKLILEIKDTFFILNISNIPQTLLNNKIVFKPGDITNKVTIAFKETIEQDYITTNYLSLRKNEFECNFVNESPNVKCTKPITGKTDFMIISFDQEIPFTVDFTTCESGIENNGECVPDCPSALFLYNGQCLTKCPEGKIIKDSQCYDSCESISADSLLDVDKNECIPPTECTGFIYEKGKRCYTICAKKYNGINLYIHENTCLEVCPTDYISNVESKCIENKTTNKCINDDIETKCITECPYGTYYSKEKNNCIYDSTVTNSTPNTCEKEKCSDKGTCSIVNNKPVCTCTGNSFGSKCQYEDNTKIAEHVNYQFNQVFDKEEATIDLSSPVSISNVVELTSIITKESKTNTESNAVEQIKPTDILSMSTKLIDTLTNSVSSKTAQKEAIPFISLNIKVLILKLKQVKRLRLLGEETSGITEDNVKDMKKNLELLISTSLESTAVTELMQPDLSSKMAMIIEDDSEIFKIQVYTQDTQSLSVSTSQAQQHKLSTINVSNIASQAKVASYGVVKIDLSPEYQEALLTTPSTANRRTGETTIPQNSMRFALVDLTNRSLVPLTSIEATYLSMIPSNSIQENIIDTEKYTYFMQRDIDIYNPNDKVFAEPCYYNWKLEYDLPQKYRYNDLYSGITIGSANGKCSYKGYDTVKNSIVLECSIDANNGGGVSVVIKEIPLSLPSGKDHVDDLPTLCGGSISAIINNFGFWTYLWGFLIGLSGTIMVGVMYLSSMSKSNIQSWIASDDMAPGYTKTTVKTEEVAQETDVKLDFTANKSFGQLILYNFRTVHPLATVCRGSVVTPMMLKISILMYNIFNLFGFNALYYNEDMIGKKMDDTNRDNFGYPMKSEFHKIVYSLLTSMALTMIVRAITLVTMGKKEELTKQLDSAQSIDEKQGLCKSFWMGGIIQRIIAYIFMLGLSIFFFYYCVVFCGIYVNTQYGWFYSGLWSLFMDWVVFAPVSILIITGVESISPACGYYAKQLFWF